MMRSPFVTVVALLLVFFTVLLPMPAAAQGCLSFPHTVPAGNITNLINSIICANNSSGNSVINLTNSTYTLTEIYSDHTGLPPIASAATGGNLTINGNGATITRSTAVGTPEFRFISLNNGANLMLNQVTLRDGYLPSSTGGAIYNVGGTLKLTSVTLENNTTNAGGGIFNESGSTTILRESLIATNTANNYGGGIANSNSTLYIINSILSGNSSLGIGSSGGGGAIDTFGSNPQLKVYNSTIAYNTAAGSNAASSGIWQESGSGTYRNSIIANNNGENNCSFESGSVITDNNIDNGSSCGLDGLHDTDPLLGALASNGGPTRTHALLSGSPATDAGNDAYAVAEDGTTPLTTDAALASRASLVARWTSARMRLPTARRPSAISPTRAPMRMPDGGDSLHD